MQIPDLLRKDVVDELASVSKLMKGSKDPAKSIFYLSGAFATVDRAVKIAFDPDLLAAGFILEVSFGSLSIVQSQIREGSAPIDLPKSVLDKLADQIARLGEDIAGNREIYPTLRNIIQLTYACTAPGHYMIDRGKMKLP